MLLKETSPSSSCLVFLYSDGGVIKLEEILTVLVMFVIFVRGKWEEESREYGELGL